MIYTSIPCSVSPVRRSIHILVHILINQPTHPNLPARPSVHNTSIHLLMRQPRLPDNLAITTDIKIISQLMARYALIILNLSTSRSKRKPKLQVLKQDTNQTQDETQA